LENIPLIDLRGAALDRRTLRTRLPRATPEQNAPVDAVGPLLDDIRARGRDAVAEAAARFDGMTGTAFRVSAAALSEAAELLDPAVRSGLEEAIRRVRTVSAAEVPAPRTTVVAAGASITTRHLPAERVGLYVPGGLAVYPSSVVMNAVPAQEAGVGSIAIASPPQPDTGLPHPTVLAAAQLLGIEEVWS